MRQFPPAPMGDLPRGSDPAIADATPEAREMLSHLEKRLSPMQYRKVLREAVELARGEQVTGWTVVSALEAARERWR